MFRGNMLKFMLRTSGTWVTGPSLQQHRMWMKINNTRLLSTAATAGPMTIPPPAEAPTEKPAEPAAETKPKKLTLREKATIYLKNLYKDYRDVYFETLQEAKAKPKKATFYIILVGGILYCIWSVPEERNYFQDFIGCRENLELCAPAIRNPDTEKYINDLNKLEMKGLLRYQSLGLFSIMWRHNEDPMLAVYYARCEYLQPLYSEMWDRLIDVGFAGRWWILRKKMEDYDVNYKEWEGDKPANLEQPAAVASMINPK